MHKDLDKVPVDTTPCSSAVGLVWAEMGQLIAGDLSIYPCPSRLRTWEAQGIHAVTNMRYPQEIPNPSILYDSVSY